ncbi:MAG: hypothetical protein AAFN78_14540 [Pseudomonadota bacterium]
MNVFQMVFGIVFVVMFFTFFTTYVKHRYPLRNGKREDGEMDETAKEQMELIRQLEERVQVLEKIVTDGNYDLKRQIDELDTGT